MDACAAGMRLVARWSRPGPAEIGMQRPEETKDQPQEAEAQGPVEKKVTIEDAGTLKKMVTIEIPRERIDAKYQEMFGELGRSAQVPGFRVGHAPRRLIEKRFGKEVTEDVRNAVVGEALGPSLEDQQLKVIGEPDIKLDEIELPEEGGMSFTFEVEVAPEFELPDYKGLEIRRPAAEVTDQRLKEAMTSSLRGYGRLRPVNSPIQADDVIVANIEIKGEGVEQSLPNAELRVAPAQVEGIPLEDLPKALLGKKVGDTCQMKTTVPSAHPNESWRDKELTITFAPQKVKRLEVPKLDENLARQAGFGSPDELREAVRQNLRVRLISRHATRLLSRRYVDLLMRGVPREQIEQNAQKLEVAAAEQAQEDLKLTFLLAKLAETEEVTVEDGEINDRIAQIARHRIRRALGSPSSAIRDETAIDQVRETAKITDEPAEGAAPATKAPATKARKPGRSGGAGKKKKSTSSKK